MRMIITVHPQHRQHSESLCIPCKLGRDDDDDDDPEESSRRIPSITSSCHDNHGYASSAFPAGSNGTLGTKKKRATIVLMIITMHPQHRQQS